MTEIQRIKRPAYGVKKATTKATTPADKVNRVAAANAADQISVAFTWADTAEGDRFWASVVDRLVAISDGQSLG